MEIVPAETEQRVDLVDQSSSKSLQLSLDQIEKLRQNREAHRYSQIWTKDPHAPRGGYKKAKESQGIDVFKQNLDGSEKQVELGFERVELGPTSNFVGNAMTTGAVDMVQALLQFHRKAPEEISDGTEIERPKLLIGKEDIEKAAAAAAAARREVESVGKVGTVGALRASSDAISDYRTLHIVEWKEEGDCTIVLLERPYAEDVTWEMTLSVSIESNRVLIDYVMTGKGGAEALRRYHREIDGVIDGLDVDRCRCMLGSGTLDELLASTSIDHKNKQIRVPHSDESTVICLLLYRDGSQPSGVARGELEASRAVSSGLIENSAETANLNALKSFIRRTRNVK